MWSELPKTQKCTAKAIPFIYSFSGNCSASAPISTFMCLWAIYILPGSVHIFPPAEMVAPSWEYIIRSQTHECGNWDWGPDIPFLGIFASNFRLFFCSVRCDIALQPMWRYCHCCSASAPLNIATNLKKYSFLFPYSPYRYTAVAVLHLPLQLRWRQGEYWYMGCTSR